MARYKSDQREEYQFLTGSLDMMLPEVSVARDIAAALEQLDFSPFDQLYKNDKAGSTAINPRALAGVIMLGLLRGTTSSVQLARLCECQIEFRWLAGGVSIEKSTLCDFRKRHLEELLALSNQVLSALGQNGFLPGENLGMDGTIVRAASSRHSRKKRKHLEKTNGHLEDVLRKKLQEDANTNDKTVNTLEKRRGRLQKALEEMTRRGLNNADDKLTVTEPDAGFKRQKDGSFAPGYNAQVVSDLDSGIIVTSEIVDAGNDSGQLQPQLEQAQAALQEATEDAHASSISSVTADGAYHDIRQMDALETEGIECYVPEVRNTNRKAPGVAEAYQAQAFTYDAATDTMRCPQGQCLRRRKSNANNTATVYEPHAQTCAACPAKPQCCPNTKGGRNVSRTREHYQAMLDNVASRLKTDKGIQLKKARSVTCEGIFARLGGLLHWRRNRMWGMMGAQAELAWRTLTHNLFILAGIWEPITMRKAGS